MFVGVVVNLCCYYVLLPVMLSFMHAFVFVVVFVYCYGVLFSSMRIVCSFWCCRFLIAVVAGYVLLRVCRRCPCCRGCLCSLLLLSLCVVVAYGLVLSL